MHFSSFTVVLLLILFQTPFAAACGTVPDPRAFAFDTVDDVQWLPNGLLLVTYRDAQSGRANHATIHHVLASFPAPAEASFSSNPGGVTFLTTNGADSSVTYAVMSHALYYGDTLTSDGFPQRLWEDPNEDGLNGNEIALSIVMAPRDDTYGDIPDA